MKWRSILLAAAIAGSATMAAAVPTTGPFSGTWTVTEAKPGPWATPAGPANANLVNAKIVISSTRIEAPAPLGCPKATYWSEPQGPSNLFTSRLTDPSRQARELGFTSDKIVILSVGCEGGETAAIPEFALVDAHTAMFALGDYIYVMKR